VGLVAYSCYSYSDPDIVYGQVSSTTQSWGMQNLLPQQAGLAVGSVFYRYTTVKETDDYMLVHVQNENAQGPGYVFRETDDWTGQPGNTINKLVSVGGIPLEYWGSGSIEVEGSGIVSEPLVVYSYSYDPCFDPQSDPRCSGFSPEQYVQEVTTNYKDPLEDDLILAELEQEEREKEDEEEERQRLQMAGLKGQSRLEVLLGGINKGLVDSAQEAKYASLTYFVLPTAYYDVLRGGSYNDSLELKDASLPTNPKANRVGLAQDLLHQKMVESQFETK
jgi:hypothetical protein